MPGGDRAAYETLRPFLEAIAARSASGACVAYCGSGSAGHFVKMVHNGIEYGDMQLIAETVFLLRQGLGRTAAEAAAVFEDWNRGELDSYLVEITAAILRTPDPQGRDGAPLVDAILDQAAQKGTGRWTVMAAAELGVPIPTLAAAVEARSLSADKPRRVTAAMLYPAPGQGLGSLTPDDLRDALYAAKIASYTQGFDLLRKASEDRGYGTVLPDMARIWTGGCIIRARFLEAVVQAFSQDPAPELLAFAPFFADALQKREPAWRKVVAAAALAGLPVPGLFGLPGLVRHPAHLPGQRLPHSGPARFLRRPHLPAPFDRPRRSGPYPLAGPPDPFAGIGGFMGPRGPCWARARGS